MLVNVPRLVSAYYTSSPIRPIRRTRWPSAPPATAARRSSHSFNEDHILAISQAICEYRAGAGHHRAALRRHGHARAVRAGADARRSRCSPPTASTVVIQAGLGYTPTPVISHAILAPQPRAQRPGSPTAW